MSGQLENVLDFAIGVLVGLRAKETQGYYSTVDSGWTWVIRVDVGTDGLAGLEVQVADRGRP